MIDNLCGWGFFFFTLWNFLLLMMVFIDALSCPNEWDFFCHISKKKIHIIYHSLGKSKPSNVYVNQQENRGPKLLCLLHS